MTLLIKAIEGFENCLDPDTYKYRWTQVDNPVFAPGRLGGRCLSHSLPLTSVDFILNSPSFATNSCVAGVAIKFDGIFNVRALAFANAAGSQIGVILSHVSGDAFTVAVNRGATQLGISEYTFPLNEWMYLEFFSYVHSTNGKYEVRINQVTILEGENVNTRNQATGGITRLFMNWVLTSGTLQIDDLYVAAQLENEPEFLGDCVIHELVPSADYDAEFTPTPSSPNADNVKEAILDSDSSYNEESTIAAKDFFDYSETVTLGRLSRVKAVQGTIMVKSDDGSDTNSIGPAFLDPAKAEESQPYREVAGVTYQEVFGALRQDFENQEVANLKIGYKIDT